MEIFFRIFSPTKLKIIIFLFLLFIMWAGYGQTYAFKDGEEIGLPKPFLYDLLGIFPFWELWLFLSIPLKIVESLFSMFGIRFFPNGYPFIIKNIVYFYFLASLLGYYFEAKKMKNNENSLIKNKI